MGEEKDIRAPVLTVILAVVFYGFAIIRKKKMSPITLIVIAAVLGIMVYGVR